MKSTQRKPNFRVSIFIPEEDMSIIDEFDRLIRLDSRIDKSRVKNPRELRSIVVRSLVKRYVEIMRKTIADNNTTQNETN